MEEEEELGEGDESSGRDRCTGGLVGERCCGERELELWCCYDLRLARQTPP